MNPEPTSKHYHVGFGQAHLGLRQDLQYGRKVALHLTAYALKVQADYDSGWKAGQEPAPKPEGDLFS